MRLCYPLIEHLFHFESGFVNTLIIENPSFFTEIISDIYNQTEGNEGKAVLSKDYTPIAFSKNAELLTQFVPFNINQKNLLTKLCQNLEKTSVAEDFFLPTQQLLSDIEKWIYDLAFSLPSDVEITKLSPANLIKALGIIFTEDNSCLAQKLLDFMELTRELDRDKLFIFVNLRSYMDNSQCEKFFETVISHDFRIFLIDSSEKQLLINEKRVIIDEDLCEI